MRTTVVAAAVLIQNGRVLLTQRKQGSHLAGTWEFPGGKILDAEDPRAGLVRELEEELGIQASVGEIVDVTFHRYEAADKCVLLLFFEAFLKPDSPLPRALDVAAFQWANHAGLSPLDFPPADANVLAKVAARLSAPPQ